MEWAVEVEDMTVAYTTKPVLWDVDMKVPIGSLAAIVGPNGAGKSTFLKILAGELEPNKGSVFITPGERMAVLKQEHFQIGRASSRERVYPGV